jgi:serpin B
MQSLGIFSARKCDSNILEFFAEVDEKGTEAAAATGIQIVMISAMVEIDEPRVFRADRPFLYLIRHNGPSKAILFMGRVSDPTL